MKMVKVKTAELTGKALDWAVAFAAARPALHDLNGRPIIPMFHSDWAHGGPLAEKYAADFEHVSDATIRCFNYISNGDGRGPTHLIALCRAIVQGHLGDEVEVPEVLL